MEVVRHADEEIQPDVVLLNPLGKPIKEALAVRIILEQIRLFRSPITHHPTGDVVDRPRELNSQMSCHARKIARLLTACKVYCEGLTPMPP